MVWNQYARCGITLLWIYGQGICSLNGIYWFTGCNNRNCILARVFSLIISLFSSKRKNCLIIFQNPDCLALRSADRQCFSPDFIKVDRIFLNKFFGRW